MSIDSPRYKDNVGIKITDEELEKIIGDRLHKNPLFYLNFLKKLIDEIDEVIPDDVLFDLLQPSFSIHDDVHNTSERPTYEGSALSVYTESVDMLIRPGVRKKLYESDSERIPSSLLRGLASEYDKEDFLAIIHLAALLRGSSLAVRNIRRKFVRFSEKRGYG
jgi:hypothetical protein